MQADESAVVVSYPHFFGHPLERHIALRHAFLEASGRPSGAFSCLGCLIMVNQYAPREANCFVAKTNVQAILAKGHIGTVSLTTCDFCIRQLCFWRPTGVVWGRERETEKDRETERQKEGESERGREGEQYSTTCAFWQSRRFKRPTWFGRRTHYLACLSCWKMGHASSRGRSIGIDFAGGAGFCAVAICGVAVLQWRPELQYSTFTHAQLEEMLKDK